MLFKCFRFSIYERRFLFKKFIYFSVGWCPSSVLVPRRLRGEETPDGGSNPGKGKLGTADAFCQIQKVSVTYFINLFSLHLSRLTVIHFFCFLSSLPFPSIAKLKGRLLQLGTPPPSKKRRAAPGLTQWRAGEPTRNPLSPTKPSSRTSSRNSPVTLWRCATAPGRETPTPWAVTLQVSNSVLVFVP